MYKMEDAEKAMYYSSASESEDGIDEDGIDYMNQNLTGEDSSDMEYGENFIFYWQIWTVKTLYKLLKAWMYWLHESEFDWGAQFWHGIWWVIVR